MHFPHEIKERIGYYVYSLSDPYSKKPFYIGKGIGDRVFTHAVAAIKSRSSSDKLDKIREIIRSGRKVRYQIIRHGLNEKEAFEIESALIDYLGIEGLTNEVSGHHMKDRGMMTADEIIAQYAAAPARIDEPSLLIIVNRRFKRNMTDKQLYNITRGNWVLGKNKYIAKYAFAVYHGIIRQIYEIKSWSKVTIKSRNGKRKFRYRFQGQISSDMSHYKNKKITRYLKKGNQSPVLYINCKPKKRKVSAH